MEHALWELVAGGLVTSDGFQALRRLLSPSARGAVAPRRAGCARRRRGRAARGPLVDPRRRRRRAIPTRSPRRVAEQLLARWGVVFRDLLAREKLALPWREILRALRRLEARGVVRGGRFVTGFTGEQYALPGAVDALRAAADRAARRARAALRADPLNLVGILTPGPRVPALRTQQVVYRDGRPLRDAPAAVAGERGLSA